MLLASWSQYRKYLQFLDGLVEGKASRPFYISNFLAPKYDHSLVKFISYIKRRCSNVYTTRSAYEIEIPEIVLNLFCKNTF